jgi:hypothetical protein
LSGYPSNYQIWKEFQHAKIDFPYYFGAYEEDEIRNKLDICYEGPIECLQTYAKLVDVNRMNITIESFIKFVFEKEIDLIVTDLAIQVESSIAAYKKNIPLVGISGPPLSLPSK